MYMERQTGYIMRSIETICNPHGCMHIPEKHQGNILCFKVKVTNQKDGEQPSNYCIEILRDSSKCNQF
jgi:hypothetical protein